MKKVLLSTSLLSVLLLTGCTQSSMPKENRDNGPYYDYRKVCIDNVYYLEASRRVSIYINPITLKPQKCKRRYE